MTTITCNVHTDDDTRMSAHFLKCESGDFTSLKIGDLSVFLSGDNAQRLADTLNAYLAREAAHTIEAVAA